MDRPFRIERLDAAALARELDALARLLHVCVHGGAAVSFVLPFELAQAQAFWRETVLPGVERGLRRVLAGYLGDRVVGTVQLDLETSPNQPHRANVAKLMVHPSARGRGIARALMQALEREAVAAGRTLVTLDTRTGDLAEPLYLSLGYEAIGSIPGYALDADRSAMHAATFMYKTLPPSPP